MDKPAVVMDNGSAVFKAGLSHEAYPRATFRTCVGHQRRCPNGHIRMDRSLEPSYYVGEEAFSDILQKRDILTHRYPVEHGVIQNWDDMEKIWKHTFDHELHIMSGDSRPSERCGRNSVEDASVLMTEVPFNPEENRERMTQVMFETFNVRRFYLALGPVLALCATGRTTGVQVDCGDGISHVVPIFEGFSFPHATKNTRITGRDLTDYMCGILSESEIDLCPLRLPPDAANRQRRMILCAARKTRESAQKIKEELCYVSMNFDEEVDNFEGKERSFELPDASVVTVHNQIIRCPELLLSPHLGAWGGTWGLHENTKWVIDQCDADLRSDLFANVQLSGGGTCFPGLRARMQQELQELTDHQVDVNSINDPLPTRQQMMHPINMAQLCPASPASVLGYHMRQQVASQLPTNCFHPRAAESMSDAKSKAMPVPAAWLGGSILSSLSTFGWVHSTSQPDASPPIVGYDDIGPRIVHQMCNM